ncbi:thioredoxin domain-containing protein 15 [Phlebotomus argentipes]|uniref:thioredoxin domain-containing protein 15 n=1 Tax=Phlebotomus argentipes TaxID=94469 RepID=UPI00289351E8|nr:thioredoxin domain-containing protein 15 [Phlebotomus argentipes]
MHKICIFLLFLPLSVIHANEFKGLQFLINIITGEFMESKGRSPAIQLPNSEEMSAVTGQTNFSFVDFISHRERRMCLPHDVYEAQATNDSDGSQKSKNVRVKCIPNATGNKTVQVVQSMKEVVSLLSPHGNSTKRNLPGKCVLVLFFTRSCPGSALMGPHFVALAKVFPNLTLAAIDAFKYHNLNTEFGIIGLPTLMLFHQGRPVVRFNDTQSTVNSFINFVTRHTDLWPPSIQNAYVTSEDFNGPLPNKVEYETDYYLYLAWAFIVFCAGYYFTKSRLYSQIVEMIQRNWRESEAQIE